VRIGFDLVSSLENLHHAFDTSPRNISSIQRLVSWDEKFFHQSSSYLIFWQPHGWQKEESHASEELSGHTWRMRRLQEPHLHRCCVNPRSELILTPNTRRVMSREAQGIPSGASNRFPALPATVKYNVASAEPRDLPSIYTSKKFNASEIDHMTDKKI